MLSYRKYTYEFEALSCKAEEHRKHRKMLPWDNRTETNSCQDLASKINAFANMYHGLQIENTIHKISHFK